MNSRMLKKHSRNSPDTVTSFGNPQSTPDTLELLNTADLFRNLRLSRTLMKPSENSLRQRKHHLKAFSELSGHTLEIHQYFPDALQKLSGNIPDTQETSGNSLRHWNTLGPSAQLSELKEMFRNSEMSEITWTLETPLETLSHSGHSETS